jgi:fatty-acyl-CoA synthase
LKGFQKAMPSLLSKLSKTKLLSVKGLKALFLAIWHHGANPMALLAYSARMFPERIAVSDREQTSSYSSLFKKSLALACYFHEEAGITASSRVALLSFTHRHFVIAFFAVARLGASITLINTGLSKNQISQILKQHKIDVLLFEDSLSEKIDPDFRRTINLNTLTDIQHKKDFRLKRQPSGMLSIPTGGTSGKLKFAGRRASGRFFLFPFLTLLNRLNLHRHNSIYIAVPASHGYGLSCLIVTLLVGKKAVLRSRFHPEKTLEIIRSEKVDVIALVPTLLNRLLSQDEETLKRLKVILTGGAPLPTPLSQTVYKKLGPVLYNLYGTSESGFCVFAGPQDLVSYPGTIGKAIPGVSVHILDRDGKKVSTGITGILHLKTSWSMRSMKHRFIPTGDLAFKNREGYLFLKGRDDDMIVSAGLNVYPADLEMILLKHPKVSEAVVIGIEDNDFGERLCAFVVSDVDKNDLMEWLRPRVARFQVPKEIIPLDEIPHFETGKINRQALLKKINQKP